MIAFLGPREARQSRTPAGRRARTIAAALCTAGLAGALLLAATLRDPTPRFMERRSHLAAIHEGWAETIDGHRVQSVTLSAASGLEVEVLLKRPAAPPGSNGQVRRPLVLLLGGHNTGRNAVRLIPDTRGTVVAAMNYPYRGEHRVKGLRVLRYVPAIREAVLDTPPAVMLALDYLLRQPDVDPRQVEVVGVSLGAPFVVIAGALDTRITRVWAVHGSGGSYGPLELNLRRAIPFTPARVLVAGLASMLISGPRLAPEHWAGRIAPRPFVMLNARDDAQMARPLVDRLYASAGEPKTMMWMDGGHVRARPEVVRPLVDMVLSGMLATPNDSLGASSPGRDGADVRSARAAGAGRPGPREHTEGCPTFDTTTRLGATAPGPSSQLEPEPAAAPCADDRPPERHPRPTEPP